MAFRRNFTKSKRWKLRKQTKKLLVPVYGIAALALIFNPVMPMVKYLPTAHAAAAGDVVINEFSANSSPDWVELYNTTGSSIDLTGWELHDSTSNMEDLATSIPANGFLAVDVSNRLNVGTDEIHLLDDTTTTIDSLVYDTTGPILYPGSGESTARTTDGGSTWATGNPTKGSTNNPAGTLLAENFNTHFGTNYKGISVGFNAKDFGTVTDISVTLERADGSTVTKTSGPAVLNLINGAGWEAGDGKLSTPFVIQEGTFTEAGDVDGGGDLYWDPAPATTWDASTAPVKATIEVTDENGAATVENTTFNEGAPSWPTYFSLLPQSSSTVTVYGDTAAGENQPGWLFNRDASTSTPFEFNTDEASVGNGSLYVEPISSNSSNKFIAENFLDAPVNQLNSIAYDFLIGSGGSTSDANEFYLNFYANIDDSNNYYDCRFDYVPSTGSTAGFTTATFATGDSPVHVQKRGDRIASCPETLDNMPAGSYVRAFAINVGDTSANDTGLDGYLDKVVIDQVGAVTTYDFEPDTTKPTIEILNPDADTAHNGTFDVVVKAQDAETGVGQSVVNLYNGSGFLAPCVNENGGGAASHEFTCTIDTTAHPDGDYYIKTNARDVAGNLSQTLTRSFLFDNTKPGVNIDSPAHDRLLNNSSFTVEGTATDASTSIAEVKYTVTEINGIGGSYVASIDNGVTNGKSNWDFDVSGLSDGFYRLKVQAFDEAGNWKYKYHDVEVDTAAPAQVEGLQIRKGHSASGTLLGCGGYTNTNQIRVEWTPGPEDDIDYYWFGTQFNTKHKKVDASKNFYHGNMTPGHNPYHYTIIAVDKAGNESLITDQCGLVLDTEDPLADILNPDDGDLLTGTVELEGKVTDDNPMNSYFRIEKPDGTFVTHSLFTDGRTTHAFDWDTTTADDGIYNIYFEARDKADNKDGSRNSPGASVDVVSVTVDNSDPEIDLTSILVSLDKKLSFDLFANDVGPAGLKHVAANIYDETNTNKLISLGSGNPTRLNVPHSGLPLGTPTFDTTVSDVDVSSLATGTYTLRAFARDHADNELRFETEQFSVDNTAPVVDAGSDDDTDGLSHGLVGSVSDADTSVANTLWTQVGGPGTATFDDDSAASTDVTVDAFGTYTFQLEATDDAGNSATDTVEITFNDNNVQGVQTTNQPNQNNQQQFSTTTLPQTTNTGNNNEENNQNDENEESSNTNSNNEEENEDGEVAGTSTSSEDGLGMWWLIAAPIVLGILFFALRRRTSDEQS